MCGRFTLTTSKERLEFRFQLANMYEIDHQPRFNIAPTQNVLAVVSDGEKNRAGQLRWGLIPSFTKDKSIGAKMINARAETIVEKPSFKRLLPRRRCLILADSFYEWRQTGENKVPMRARLKSGEPFAFAGLWDRWHSPDGEEITSCTIITTEANSLLAEIHPRMPVILDEEGERAWLDRSITDPILLQSYLKPYDSQLMEVYPVSPLVNSAKNDLPACIEPVEP